MAEIVFDQQGLDAAVASGALSILLCDNTFTIPLCSGVHYCAIGDVEAQADMSPSEAQRYSIEFEGFEPVFAMEDAPVYAHVPHGIHPAVPGTGSFASSFATSFVSSFMTSFTTSFSGSFFGMYEYEYEYETGSFTSSFASSFSTSFRMSASFGGSAASLMRIRKKYIVREIAVNGYGLNLI